MLAAMYLARFRRSVLVVDSGLSRAQRIPRSHNYPGMSGGVSGAELISSLREQMALYDVQRIVGAVESIRATPCGFEARVAESSVEARTVVLATGVHDVEPEMQHLAEALRDGAVRYCPVCDAFEVIGQKVGVLAAGPAGVSEAICLGRYSDRVTVFQMKGQPPLDDEQQARLQTADIGLAAGFVDSVRAWNGRVTIEHGGDRTTECDTVYCAMGLRVHSGLATMLGAAVDEAGYLRIDRHQQTTVPGLYAAGDVASGLNQISVAYGGAAIAAAAINVSLSGRGRAG